MSDNRLYNGPDGTALRFFFEASKNNFVSEKKGRPVYDKVLYVEVITPGSNQSAPIIELERTFCGDANMPTPRRNKAQYEKYNVQIDKFKSSEEGGADLSGTPLSAWPVLDVAMVATLKGMNIHTVQQLAAVQDIHLQNLGHGGRALREQAQSFVALGGASGDTAPLAAENANLKTEIDRLTGEIAALNSRFAEAVAERDALKLGVGKATPGKATPVESKNAKGSIV